MATKMLTDLATSYALLYLSLSILATMRAGELTVSSDSCFDSSSHLAWGDVGVDDPTALTVLNIKLKAFKTAMFLLLLLL